jgi:DUF971 family protein
VTPLALQFGANGLDLEWPDGPVSLSASLLRAACRCGRCRALGATEALAAAAAAALLQAVHPVGNYGVQLVFDDGHDRGIYPWVYLRELAQAQAPRRVEGESSGESSP